MLEYLNDSILKEWLETMISGDKKMMDAGNGYYHLDEPTMQRRNRTASYIPATMFWR